MTVTYTSEVTTSRGIGCFLKLLLRWRGSIYKLIWPDILLFMIFYYIINMTYRFALNDTDKVIFEKIVRYCEKYGNLIPLSFVLGFYVNLVMTRWWSQYNAIPYPDDIALLISANIQGDDEHARVVRRTLMRYVCLCFAMTLSLISPKVKKRFPTLEHFVEAGLMQKDELKIMEDLNNEYPSYSKYWLPLVWASNIVTRARHEGMIRDDASVNNILSQINKFKNKCGTLLDYDWISVPLVYTQVNSVIKSVPQESTVVIPFYSTLQEREKSHAEYDRGIWHTQKYTNAYLMRFAPKLELRLLTSEVVTLAVYTYFMTALLGRQWTEAHNEEDSDLYFPALTILEYFFYMGWLKVAETLINPFGDDDDDFEVVWMIDRHVQVTYLIVDKIHHEHPKLMKDQYWTTMAPHNLPYTLASEQFREEYPVLSTDGLIIEGKNAEILQPENPSKEKVDGKGGHHSESLIRRLFRKTSNRTRTTAELNRVTTDNPIESNEKLDTSKNVNEPDDNDFTEFDKLKKLRHLLIKRKLIKYMEVLKDQTNINKAKLFDEEN